jgi:hypothetical protein
MVKFKHGDIFVYVAQVSFITYCYLLETSTLADGFARVIDNYSKMDFGEAFTVLADNIRSKVRIYNKYGPK